MSPKMVGNIILIFCCFVITFTNAQKPVDNEKPIFNFFGKQNHQTHHTDKYVIKDYNKELVFRRGFEFQFEVDWRKSCDLVSEVKLNFQLMTFVGNNKLHFSFVANEISNDRWSANYTCENQKGLLNVNIPTNASIGAFGMIVQEKGKDGKSRQHIAHKNVIIVFNPYHKDDDVYMASGLQEYLENTVGLIWMGNTGRRTAKTWFYAQFESLVLNATLFALNKCNLTAEQRSSPVEVSRSISAISNDYDDWGILIGRWDGIYEDVEVPISETKNITLKATSPGRWLGSYAILKQYRETQLPVPYGQCWVFGGLMITMFRTLGIPARPVTCYYCGHDNDNNLMIDYFLDAKGKFIKEKTRDSIWNYHVWDQAWMRRRDLDNAMFDGWQDVDGTPQEKSGPKFQMGPTPVNAVKMGIVDAQFDLPFVYSEVNADIVYWKEESIYLIETSKIGAAVVTKELHSNKYIDITHDYKAKEKSKMERNTLRMIAQRMNINHPAFNTSIKQRSKNSNNIAVDIECAQNINLGDNLKVKIRVKPQTWSVYGRYKARKVEYDLILKTKHYDGKSSKKIKLDTKTVDMPKNGFLINQVITPEMYDSLDFSTISVKIRVRDVQSKSLTLKETEVEVKHPPLHVSIKGYTRDKKKTVFVASFKNPMPTDATKCALVAETQTNERVEFAFNNIRGNSKLVKDIVLNTPPKNADLVLFSFNCDKIDADMVQLCAHHPNVRN